MGRYGGLCTVHPCSCSTVSRGYGIGDVWQRLSVDRRYAYRGAACERYYPWKPSDARYGTEAKEIAAQFRIAGHLARVRPISRRLRESILLVSTDRDLDVLPNR